jgi:hypothetical protein
LASSAVSFVCEAIENGFGAAVDYAVQIATVLEQRGAEAAEFLKKLVEGVRGFGPGGQVRTRLVVDVWRSFEKAVLIGRGEKLGSVLVPLVRECMRPTFEGTWSSPESWRTIQMASGLLASSDMSYLVENVWAAFERSLPELSRDQLEVLVEVIDDWSQVAGGYSLALGGKAAAEQVHEATAAVQRIVPWVLERSVPYPGLRAAIRMHVERIGIPVPESDPLIEAFFDTREPGEDWRAWGEAHRAQIAALISPLLEEPERLCEFLASVKQEIATIRGWAFADPIRTAFSVIDEAEADHLTWLKTAQHYGLFPEADILLRSVLRRGNYEIELIRDLLAEPSARSTIVTAALELEDDSALFQAVYPEISPDDIGQLQLAIHRDSCSGSAIQALLTHPVEGLRAATAAALLASSKEQEAFDAAMFDGAWRSAILELQVPLEFKLLFGKHDFFEKLLQRAPDVYEELLLRIVSVPAESFDWRALHDAFEDTAYLLPADAKTRVWDKVPHSYWRPTIFRTLAGGDSEWIESLLESGSVDAEFVLDSVNGLGKPPPIEDLARILVPRGCDPTRIASRVQYGTGLGEEHERIAGYLEHMGKLAESAEPAVKEVGEAGRAYFAPLHERALREARQKEIRGEL